MNRGLLFIFTGPSGVGKGTVMRELIKRRGGSLWLSVSCTTRAPRSRERGGVDYVFVTREEFLSRAKAGEFLEYAEYGGNLYGTLLGPVEKKLEQGRHVVLEIEVLGAKKVMEKRPDAVSLFMMPPSFSELEGRLSRRGTETDEVRRVRLEKAIEEMRQAGSFAYVVQNRDVSRAADDISAIIRAEELKYINRNKLSEVIADALSRGK